MTRVALIGLGLLGSSLGMALRGHGYHRIGWTRRPDMRDKALSDNVVDEAPENPADALESADITVICVPIGATIEFVATHAAHWRPGSVVTDVGSVKSLIMSECATPLAAMNVPFIGSHPMAGKEKSGADAAVPDLFRNAMVFVTPTPSSAESDIAAVESFWTGIGSRVRRVSAREHDAAVAHTSHLCHLAAYATALTVLGPDDSKARELRAIGCAGGFKDTTRIASSDPAMWIEIFRANRGEILQAADGLLQTFAELRGMIQSEDWGGLEIRLDEAKKLRDDWVKLRF